MLITEGQKQKYIMQHSLIGRFERLESYHIVTNTRNKNEPYILKDYFGSKHGLLGQTAKIHSGLAKIYKKSLKLRKNCISPKYLTTKYIEELADNHMIDPEDVRNIQGFQKQIQDLYKEMKKLANTIYTKHLLKKGAGIVLLTSCTLGMIVGCASFFGFLLALPALALASDFVVMICVLAVTAAGSIGGLSTLVGFPLFLVMYKELEKEESEDVKRAIKLKREVLEDLKKRQSEKPFPGLPPRLIFTKDENGNIGIPISNYLVAYEPQDKIKEFYHKYTELTEGFKKHCETHDIGLFFNEGLQWEDLRPLWKASRNYENFVEEMKKEGGELKQKLLKSHKGVGPGKNPKIKWSASDELAYLHAEWLSKLEYEGLKPDEIKNILKVQAQGTQGCDEANDLIKFVENATKLPDIQIKAATVEGVTVDPSNLKKVERRTMEVTASPNLLDIKGDDPEYEKVVEQIKAATKSSADDFTPTPSIL